MNLKSLKKQMTIKNWYANNFSWNWSWFADSIFFARNHVPSIFYSGDIIIISSSSNIFHHM